MSRLDELIKELCPDGVEIRPLWEITIWDKKFNTVANYKQKKIFKYYYYLSNEIKSLYDDNGDIKVLTTSQTNYYVNRSDVEENIVNREVVSIPWGGNPVVQYYNGEFVTTDNRIATSVDCNILSNKFLYYVLKNKEDEIASFYRGSGIKHPDMSKVLDLSIPLPPLEIQEEIVKILDKFTDYVTELQAELQARRQQYEYYFKKVFNMFSSSKVKLGDIGTVKMCKRILKSQTSTSGEIPFYKIGTFGKDADAYISKELYEEYLEKYSHPKEGAVLISCSGTIGRTVVYDGKPAYFQDSNIVWLEHDETKVSNEYLRYAYRTNPWVISSGGTISRLYNDGILNAEIPLPTLEQQQQIVGILDKFDNICNDINNGLPAEIEARQKQYEYYRDKLLTFKELS